MRLRYQLLLAGAVTLILPVVAYHAVQQMDMALGESRAYELLQRSESGKTLIGYSGLLKELSGDSAVYGPRDLYAERIRHRMALDGYEDDWVNNDLAVRRFKYGDNKSTSIRAGGKRLASVDIRMAVTSSRLHLFLKVIDDNVVYHDPTRGQLSTGDHVSVYIQEEDGDTLSSTFRAVAPGAIVGHRFGPRIDGLRAIQRMEAYRGFWSVTNSGYQLELDIPLPAVGTRFGFAVVDNDRKRATSQEAWIGTVDPGSPEAMGRLVYQSQPIEKLLNDFVPPGSRARVFDEHGWLRADANKLYQSPKNPALLDPARSNIFNALLYRFFEWILKTQHRINIENFPLENRFSLDTSALVNVDSMERYPDWSATDSSSVRRYVNHDRDQVMGRLTTTRAENGKQAYLLFETNEASANAFTSSAMVRLFSRVTLLSLLVAGSLLLFATWLSWRIRQLTHQTRSAVSGDGKFIQQIKPSDAADEIGELSRSFARVLERSAGYTQYLESLASKLSHELRTPLSVVKTSLENIDSAAIDSNAMQLLHRAQGGAEQLSELIRSMSEATRLEQTVQRAEFIRFDAENWLNNARDTYRSIYPQRQFQLRFQAEPKPLYAVPELLQQALDKLVANAVDFSTHNGLITILAESDEHEFELSVINDGPPIDDTLAKTVFEPMYSARKQSSGQEAHLGLGLYIVRLISEAHQGHAWVQNHSGNAVQVGFSIKR
ncbi:MAG: hypothetical protein KTR32_34245 [Granulosicoccus sp.]|nr:hypothetical protein [Granulosicoccus sp.]